MDLSQPGPLARRKKAEPCLAPLSTQKTPVQKKVPAPPTLPAPKKKKKPYKRLRMFDSFDEKNYHPTLSLEWQGGVLMQKWRHKKTDEPEWRPVPVQVIEVQDGTS